mgnify:FL=1
MGLGFGKGERVGRLTGTDHGVDRSGDVGEPEVGARGRKITRGEHKSPDPQTDDRQPTDDEPSPAIALDGSR